MDACHFPTYPKKLWKSVLRFLIIDNFKIQFVLKYQKASDADFNANDARGGGDGERSLASEAVSLLLRKAWSLFFVRLKQVSWKVASVQAAYSDFFDTESGKRPCGILWLMMASGMWPCGILQLVMACSKRPSSRLWSVTDSGKQPFGIPHSVQYCLICWTCV